MGYLKALLFDLDGTLIETESINAQAYAIALKDVDVHVNANEVIDVIRGRHWSYFLPLLTKNKVGLDALEKVAAKKQLIYASLVGEACINKSLIQLINSCADNYKICLVTTASRAAVDLILPILGLSKNFDFIVTGDDVEHRKPCPDAYVLVSKLLDVAPDECLVFEDSPAGIQSARAFGAQVLQVHPFK